MDSRERRRERDGDWRAVAAAAMRRGDRAGALDALARAGCEVFVAQAEGRLLPRHYPAHVVHHVRAALADMIACPVGAWRKGWSRGRTGRPLAPRLPKLTDRERDMIYKVASAWGRSA